jgi:LysM repeat protein
VVQSGETLSGIALQLGTTVENLAAADGIANPGLVYAPARRSITERVTGRDR